MASRERGRAGKLESPRFLGAARYAIDVAIERRLGRSPAPKVEEVLALHGEFQPALVAYGLPSYCLAGEWRVVETDLVVGPGDRRIVDGHVDVRRSRARSLNLDPCARPD